MLVSSREKGHLHPLWGVAQHLVADGHAVGWLCLPSPPESLRALGVEPLAAALPPGPGLVKNGAALAALVRDPAALRGWIRGLLLDAVPGQTGPILEVIRRFRPDAVALDPMLYSAVFAAHRAGVPFLGVSSSLNPVTPLDWSCALVETVQALAPERAAMFAREGLDVRFRVCDALSPHGTTAFAGRAYVGDVEVPEGVALVGPARAVGARDAVPFPWERLDSRPQVLVSFGSQIAHQPEVFAKVTAAAASLGLPWVVNTGAELGPDAAASWAGQGVAAPYVPQLELLRRTGVLVTHGGANSVMEALTAGVPLLLSPVCNDQPLQARFLARSGAGRVLDLQTASVPEISHALAALQGDGPERAAAAGIARAYAALDGSRQVATRLVALT
jgi:UDP:flavonoid glycosyltransferase YjiC (YdhE family)